MAHLPDKQGNLLMGEKSIAARGRLGVAYRLHGNEPGAVDNAYRDLAAAKINDYIEKTVANAPPLTTEQREQLARLLMSGGETP